jgi:hypothetical protein
VEGGLPWTRGEELLTVREKRLATHWRKY